MRLRLLIISGVTALIGLLGLAQLAGAAYIRTANNLTTSQNTINDTVYVAGRTIDIDSEVFGDVFCAGQNVTVSGTVHGDVICAGQNVTLNGKVDGDIRLAGQTVTINSAIAGNATVGGQSLVLTLAGSIGGDLSTGAGDATLNGKIGRDVLIGGQEVTVNNAIGRNLKAGAENLHLTSRARVGGNVELTSKNNIDRDSGAVVAGKVTRTEPKQETKKNGFNWWWLLYVFVAMLLTALVLALLFPRPLHTASDQAVRRPWVVLLTGFLASLAAPVVILLLTLTVAGIPLAVLAAMVWMVLLFLSGPLAAYYLGRLILRGSTRPLLIMLTGALILLVVYFIPFLGMIVMLFAVWFGLGMLLQEFFRLTPRPAYNLQTANAKNKI